MGKIWKAKLGNSKFCTNNNKYFVKISQNTKNLKKCNKKAKKKHRQKFKILLILECMILM